MVVLGIAGRIPFAGVAWQTLHYIEGFRRLGHDVYYVEDTDAWPFDPEQNGITGDSRYTVDYIARLMDWCGFSDRWAYRSAPEDGRTFGLSEEQLAETIERADVLVNLSGATTLREEHLRVPVRIYLETDPGLPQIEIALGSQFTIDLMRAHTHHFTYAENIGRPGCGLPVDRFSYLPTRQPIILHWWSDAKNISNGNGRRFTTVASWQQTGKDIEWNGETYTWSKHHQFLKFIDLPRKSAESLELALACGDGDALKLLQSHGWTVVDALPLSKDTLPYRDYIFGSRGEFTVAKDQNIRLRSGWFSDRSACYLAAGRPVITQDTGFGAVLPTEEGLFAFSTMEEIMAALQAVGSDYERHSRAARDIAQEYFCAEKVLGRLLDASGLL